MGEWREVGPVKKGLSLISRDLQGKIQGEISFFIWGIVVAVVKVEVRRNLGCGLSSESEKWELIVRGT